MKELSWLFDNYTMSIGVKASLINLSDEKHFYANSQRSFCNDFCTRFSYLNCRFHCKSEMVKSLEVSDEKVFTCPFGLSSTNNIVSIDYKLILICLGKVFVTKPDLKYYEDMADKLGYDKKLFIDSVKSIPVISEEQLLASINYIQSLIHSLGERVLNCNNDYNPNVVTSNVINDEKAEFSTKEELYNSLILLKEANHKLKDENAMKNRFISSMSHELRAPLNAVLGFNDLLKSKYYGSLNSKQEEYVNLISKSAKHLLSLIDDIIDIARIDSCSNLKKVEKSDLVKALSDTISLFTPQVEDKNITLNCIIPRNMDSIACSNKHARQILINLISNAIKFTPDGGYIEVRVENYKDKAKIIVSDNGIGIRLEDLENIFKDFFQSEYSKQKVSGGSGIGLALTKRLVESYNGEIGVKSRPGKGSLFWFTMPTISSQIEQNKILVNEY